MCVEIEASKDMVRSIEVEVRNESTVHVMVEYPWMPLKCSNCCMFGHTDKTCAIKVVSNTVKVWKPKKVDIEVKTIKEGKQSKDEADSTVRQIKGKDKATDDQKEANTQQSNSSNRFSILEAEIEGSEPSLSVEGESKEEGGNEEPRKQGLQQQE